MSDKCRLLAPSAPVLSQFAKPVSPEYLQMVVSGLSDYGRCAFGSGRATSSTTPDIIQASFIAMIYDGGTFPFKAAMSIPFRLRRLDHVVFRVRDPIAMQHFYCEVLGCTVEKRQDGIGLVQLRAGESLIDLVDVNGKLGRLGGAAPGEAAHNIDHVCLSVEGYDESAIVKYLKAHDVRVGDIGLRYGAEGEGPSIYLFDPEGNMLELKGPPQKL